MYLLLCQGDLQMWLVVDDSLRDLVCPINDDACIIWWWRALFGQHRAHSIGSWR
jgi:hypothetical protein